MLFKAGNQVPVIPLVDVVGNAARTAPEQIGATAVKVGVTLAFTVILIVLLDADDVSKQLALLVKMHFITSPLFNVAELYVELFEPTFTNPIIH